MKLLKSMFLGGLCAMSSVAAAQVPTATLVDDKPLMVYGDSVKFTARINVPKHKVFKQEGTYVVLPELGEHKFDPIRIPSSQLNNAAANGIDVIVEASALFDEDMIGNSLEIEHEYEYKNGTRNTEFKDMDDVADCCVTTGTLFALNGQYELMKFDYTPAKSVPLKVVAQVNFPLDISRYSGAEADNVIDEIGAYLKEYPNSSITIRGFASPEGTLNRNTVLAQNRAEEVEKWLVSNLRSEGYGKYITYSKISTESVSEDWEGFEYIIRNSTLSEDKQNKVLDILSSDMSPARKEDRVLATLGGFSEANKFLMPLRRTTIIAENKSAVREGYTAYQIDSVNAEYNKGLLTLSSMNDVFTQEELLQASQRTNAAAGKLMVLNTYYKNYPGDVRAYSNLGALKAVDMNKFDVVGGDDALVGVGFSRDLVDIDSEMDLDKDKLKYKYKYKKEDMKDNDKMKMKMKIDLSEAEVLLMKAYHNEPKNFVVLNNLGAHYLTIGEYDKAWEYLEKSAKYQDSEGVNYNMGVYHARMGDYDKALAHFNKAPNVDGIEYNRGLAKLVTGDNRGALKDLNTFSNENPQYALGHYLTAVAAARIGDMDIMTKKLQYAMTRNSNLSDIAAEDLEFRSYWDDKEFKRAADDDRKERMSEEK